MTNATPVSIRMIVTDFANVLVSEAEMRVSGARWSKRGRPANLNAKLLMDFMGHATFEDWLERNAIPVDLHN